MEKTDIIKSVKEDILERSYSLVLYGADGLVHASFGSGVKPLLHVYENDDTKGLYAGDKIIGRASAMILTLMDVSYIFAKIISEPAIEFLTKYNIELEYEYSVDRVMNRDKSGLCPMEESVLGEEDPKRALELIKAKIAQLSESNK